MRKFGAASTQDMEPEKKYMQMLVLWPNLTFNYCMTERFFAALFLEPAPFHLQIRHTRTMRSNVQTLQI